MVKIIKNDEGKPEIEYGGLDACLMGAFISILVLILSIGDWVENTPFRILMLAVALIVIRDLTLWIIHIKTELKTLKKA